MVLTESSRPHAGAVLAALSAAFLALPVVAFAGNVRPFVEAGYTQPIDFSDFQDGYGIGGGLEFENSHRTSALVRIDWNSVGRWDRIERPYYGYPSRYRSNQQTMSGSIGIRAHLLRHGRVRPYVEGRWGVRIHEPQLQPYTFLDMMPTPRAYQVAGPIGALGFGLTTARFHNAGVMLGVTVEGLLHEIEHDALATARLGIVFP